MTTAIEALRLLKFNREPLTAEQQVILDHWHSGKNAYNTAQMTLAEFAAHELADKDARIAEQRAIIVELEATIRTLLDAQKGGAG